MSGSGIGRKMFVLGSLFWMVYPQPASASTHVLCADVSVGVKFDSNSAFTPGLPCEITTGEAGCGCETDYMLLWFDLTGWPSHTTVSSAKLRLTRSGGQNPSPYTVSAYGFCGDNYDWYLAPQNATGLWQYYDAAGDGDIPWKNSSGTPDTIENADYWMGGSGSTWNGTTLEISLNAAKVQDWITGAIINNGLRLESNKTSVPYFYGSGATNAADHPTLIIEADVPEPASLVVMGIGALGLLFRCRRRHRPVKFLDKPCRNAEENIE